MIYIASPYSSPLVAPVKQQTELLRYQQVLKFAAFILSTGGPPAFSPIVYGHTLASSNAVIGTDHKYWHRFNMDMLRRCEAIFALHLLGFDQSKGVKMELEVAKVLDIPVIHYAADFSEMVMQ